MNDFDETTVEQTTVAPSQEATKVARRPPDPFALIAGFLTLIAASYVLSDGRVWLPWMDLRWVLAGCAVLVGALLLAGSLRSGHQRKEN